jgi:hypothetical protein
MSNGVSEDTRDDIVFKFAESLGCSTNPPEPFEIAAALIKQAKVNGITTATAFMTGLSWLDHKEWLQRCRDALAEVYTTYPDADYTKEWLYEWIVDYATNVENMP